MSERKLGYQKNEMFINVAKIIHYRSLSFIDNFIECKDVKNVVEKKVV